MKKLLKSFQDYKVVTKKALDVDVGDYFYLKEHSWWLFVDKVSHLGNLTELHFLSENNISILVHSSDYYAVKIPYNNVK